MRDEKQFYNEPDMEIVHVFADGDVITLSGDSVGTPDSGSFDELLGNQLQNID